MTDCSRSAPGHRAAVALCLFGAGLLSCLWFLWRFPLAVVADDSVEYLQLARSIAGGGGFSSDGGITPAVYRPPLFSALLGGWFWLTASSSPLSAGVFQSIAHALGVVVSFGLFLELEIPLAWASAGGFLLALNPFLVTRVGLVLQEPVLMLFTTLAVWASVRWLRAAGLRRALVAGCAWGLCTLGKVVTWYVPFLILAMRLLPVPQRWNWRGKEAVLMLVGFVAVIAPWSTRNYLRFHHFIAVNDEFKGAVVWNVQNAVIPGEPTGEQFLEGLGRQQLEPEQKLAACWKYIRGHAGYFAVTRILRNFYYFQFPALDWFLSIRPGQWKPHEHRMPVLIASVFELILCLALTYRTYAWLVGHETVAIGFISLLYWLYWAQYTLIWGYGRFNVPVHPLLLATLLRSAYVLTPVGAARNTPTRTPG